MAVLLDPDFMAGQDEPEDVGPEAALGQAVSELLRQRRPGAVCVPVMVPWWQRLLAMHVLRSLCAPALGFLPVDPTTRTFVPERALAIELIRAALGLAAASPAGEGRAIASWVEDHSLDAAVPARVLAQIRAECDESAGIAPRGDAAGWPGPLIDAWHAARGGDPHLGLRAERVWLAYVARLRAWLRTTRSGLTGVARETVLAASHQFLAATGMRVDPDAESPP
ncbi:hypothetical protein [Amycolatopsis sp. NPDC006125]|uniref:hypothetical protein n=1 Tax=Amycolatopsis sp. NPDC006125 TaxID=3156730 RepID=UPI0033B4AC13